MPTFEVTAIDLAVVLVYVIGSRILFGWYFARKTKQGAEGYFLAGRKISWPIIGLSFYVANMSGSSFVGLPGSGYEFGIAVYNYEWIPVVVLIFFVFVLLPSFLRARVYTSPQFLEQRFDRRSKFAFSAFLLVASILIDAAAALYAGASVMRVLYPDVPVWVTVFVTAAIAGVYIFFGGLGAVVANDALQAAMILIGGTLVAVLAWMKIPSWDAVVQAAPPHGMHLFRPVDDASLPWPGIITGVLVVGIYFWATNQFVMQRTLGAKNLDHARWGSMFAGLLKLPNLFILVLPGLMARTLYPDLEHSDLIFPTMVFDLLPVGVRGILIAALAAAILSSLEAIFNSASTLFTMDFVKTFRPQTSDGALVMIGRISTLGFMVLAAVWAPQITRFPTLWQYLQSILSYVTPPIVAVFVLGIMWPRMNATGAFATLAIGIPLGAIGWVINEIAPNWPDLQSALGMDAGGPLHPVAEIIQMHYLYASGAMLLFSTFVIVAVSLATSQPPPETRGLCWQPMDHAVVGDAMSAGAVMVRRSWMLRHDVIATALLIATAILVLIWR